MKSSLAQHETNWKVTRIFTPAKIWHVSIFLKYIKGSSINPFINNRLIETDFIFSITMKKYIIIYRMMDDLLFLLLDDEDEERWRVIRHRKIYIYTTHYSKYYRTHSVALLENRRRPVIYCLLPFNWIVDDRGLDSPVFLFFFFVLSFSSDYSHTRWIGPRIWRH